MGGARYSERWRRRRQPPQRHLSYRSVTPVVIGATTVRKAEIFVEFLDGSPACTKQKILKKITSEFAQLLDWLKKVFTFCTCLTFAVGIIGLP